MLKSSVAINFLFQYMFVLKMVSNDRAFPDDLFEYQQAYISFRNKKCMDIIDGFEDNEEKPFYWRPSWILDRHFEFLFGSRCFSNEISYVCVKFDASIHCLSIFFDN